MEARLIITHQQIARLGLATKIVQRLGVDASGKPLVIDGTTGELTRGGRFLNPVGPHIAGVDAAIKELLAGAEEVGGNNAGPFVSKYYKRAPNDPQNHGAWCAAFCGWCLQQDLGPSAPYSWSARRLLDRCEEQSQAPRLGSVACWERESAGPYNGHVGLVAHVEEDTRAVWVIEGNTGPRGAVRVYRWLAPYTREVDRLIGFGVPQ